MDEREIAYLKIIEAAIHGWYLSCLVGNPAGKVVRYLDFLTHPKVGDVVLEISSFGNEEKLPDRLGTLLRIEQRWRRDSTEDGDDPGSTVPPPTEDAAHWSGPSTIYIIRTLDGREIVWDNCQFVRVPDDVRQTY